MAKNLVPLRKSAAFTLFSSLRNFPLFSLRFRCAIHTLHACPCRRPYTSLTISRNRCPELVNIQDLDGSTAMHLAASCGHLQCVLALQQGGADIRLRNFQGQTALEEAEGIGTVGSRACVELLRVQWRMLEEEAAAQMLSMLQLEGNEDWGERRITSRLVLETLPYSHLIPRQA